MLTNLADIGRILAGIALFLLGIGLLEDALHQLSGRRFKLFLKKQTASPWRAIGGGALVTALLQSSSVVSLMVLAFVGAGILTMPRALAVILGANLGTTVTGWMVALAGFSVNIENWALPAAGIAGIGFSILRKTGKWHTVCRLVFGLSLLFIGLGYIRTGFEEWVKTVDMQQFASSSLLIFLVAGFVITSLIQSSSATLALTLSALYAGVIPLTAGIAIMLGGEVGTTMKLFLASANGTAAKKRVALGNFMFNSVTTVLVMLFLRPLERLVTVTLEIQNPLIALVFFQTLVNVISILLFFPILGWLGRFLESRFRQQEVPTLYIHRGMLAEPQEALQLLEKENRHFLFAVLHYMRSCFSLPPHEKISAALRPGNGERDAAAQYEHLKYLHGEIHSYYIDLQGGLKAKEDLERLSRYFASVRNGMYAAKSVKDAGHDLEQLRNSSNDTKYLFYCQTEAAVGLYCDKVLQLLDGQKPAFHSLAELYSHTSDSYTGILQQLYRQSREELVSETEITTMLNFNREIFSAFKSFLFGVKDFLFTREEAAGLDELPGFIH